MSPFLTTLGGGSVRGFGRGRKITAVLSVTVPTNFAAALISESTAMNLSWSNSDASAQTRIYVNGSLYDTTAAGATTYTFYSGYDTYYSFEISTYKNGVESTKTATISRWGRPTAPSHYWNENNINSAGGTSWDPIYLPTGAVFVTSAETTVVVPSNSNYQLRVYDTSGTLINTYTNPGEMLYVKSSLSANTTYQYQFEIYNTATGVASIRDSWPFKTFSTGFSGTTFYTDVFSYGGDNSSPTFYIRFFNNYYNSSLHFSYGVTYYDSVNNCEVGQSFTRTSLPAMGITGNNQTTSYQYVYSPGGDGNNNCANPEKLAILYVWPSDVYGNWAGQTSWTANANMSNACNVTVC